MNFYKCEKCGTNLDFGKKCDCEADISDNDNEERGKFIEIRLKRLELTNFKGIKSLEVNFQDGVNIICGDNATGKTTVFDSFIWLLFGKDSADRKDFNIQTLDSQGRKIHKIEHNVKAVISVNGTDRLFSRTYREKWVKKKGSTEEICTGNETVCEVDNIPLKISEYQKKVSEMIDENLFKMITNVSRFCNQDWQTRREVLINMAGIGTDEEIAAENGINAITKIINNGKSIEDRLKELANSKKKINKELEVIPVRIDEITRGLPQNEMRTSETVKKDIESCKKEIKQLEKEITAVEQLGGSIQAEIQVKEIEAEMAKVKAEIEAYNAQIRSENISALREYENAKYKIRDEISFCEKGIRECKKEVSEGEKLLEKLRTDYKDIFARKFDNKVCPCCGRPYETEDLEKMQAAFNKDRANRLKEINDRGISLKEGVEISTKAAEDKEKKSAELKKQLEEIVKPVEKPLKIFDDKEYFMRIEKIRGGVSKADTSEQKDKIKVLEEKIALLEQELSDINSYTRQISRVNELTAETKEKASAVAEIEREEAEIKNFTQLKINMLEKAVNSRFKVVKFKFYNEQINGGYSETCEAIIDGVPYGALNNAAKINAGLDIINALQKYYNISAPVFVDNKESVNRLFKVESQVICLVVTDDKRLKINEEAA